jgi:hypothetical protein
LNRKDPMGLYVTYTDNWSEKDIENFKKVEKMGVRDVQVGSRLNI